MKAIKIATEAFTEILEKIVPGRTEKEIANDLDYTMRRLGADCPSFQTIVASGPRSALPHAEPSDKEDRPRRNNHYRFRRTGRRILQ